MACEAEHRPRGVFECQLCALTAPYSYVGQKPPDTQSVILLEESYVMKDPFTPDKDRFLILGSRCSVCGRLVCVGPVGMQSVLLQEVLPPLCPEEPPGLPPGDPAGPGEKERPLEEAGRPAQLAGLSRRRSPGRVLSWEPRCSLVLEPHRGGTWEPRPGPRAGSVLGAGRSRGAPRLSRGWVPTLCRSSLLCPAPRGWAGGPCVLPTGGQIQGLSPRATLLCWALNTAARGKGGCRGAVPMCGPLAPAVGGGRVCSLWLWFQPQAPSSLPSRPRLGAFCCLPAPLPSELSLGPAEANPTASALRMGAPLLSAGAWRQALPCHLTVAVWPPSPPRVRNVNKEPFPSIRVPGLFSDAHALKSFPCFMSFYTNGRPVRGHTVWGASCASGTRWGGRAGGGQTHCQGFGFKPSTASHSITQTQHIIFKNSLFLKPLRQMVP